MTLDWCYMGDTRDGLRAMIAAGIRAQTCVTSPPYWGLRDYGMPGQLGLESTPAEYVANMVEVFRLVRDVLADDGTLWLNIGDSYATGAGSVGNCPGGGKQGENWQGAKTSPNRMPQEGVKPKDLVGIPWRLAFALQADGWYLRSDIIWHKPNPMPESVTDRPTKAHEYLFLLAKSERYFYDADAIKVDSVDAPGISRGGSLSRFGRDEQLIAANAHRGDKEPVSDGKANRRTVWTVATQPYAEAHFAVMPRALVEPGVLAGTSAKGHCANCGKAWIRVVERIGGPPRGDHRKNHEVNDCKTAHATGTVAGSALSDIYKKYGYAENRTTGWEPSCDCDAGDPVPGVVLDPFLGSGTVAQVAQDLGRRWLGCELNPEYLTMQHQRTAQGALVLAAD